MLSPIASGSVNPGQVIVRRRPACSSTTPSTRPRASTSPVNIADVLDLGELVGRSRLDRFAPPREGHVQELRELAAERVGLVQLLMVVRGEEDQPRIVPR